jgi:hypothetical protein
VPGTVLDFLYEGNRRRAGVGKIEPFMELKVLSSLSRESVSGPSKEPDESNIHPIHPRSNTF